MEKYSYLRFLSFATLLMAAFIYVIFNVNNYTSSLNKQNLDLKRAQQNLEARLRTTDLENSNNLNDDLEAGLQNGTIERINPTTEVPISAIQSSSSVQASSVVSSSVPNFEESPGVVAR